MTVHNLEGFQSRTEHVCVVKRFRIDGGLTSVSMEEVKGFGL